MCLKARGAADAADEEAGDQQAVCSQLAAVDLRHPVRQVAPVVIRHLAQFDADVGGQPPSRAWCG